MNPPPPADTALARAPENDAHAPGTGGGIASGGGRGTESAPGDSEVGPESLTLDL